MDLSDVADTHHPSSRSRSSSSSRIQPQHFFLHGIHSPLTPPASLTRSGSLKPEFAMPVIETEDMLRFLQQEATDSYGADVAPVPFFIVGSQMPAHLEEFDTTPIIGWLLLLANTAAFLVGTYAMIISKWMPDTGSVILDAIKHDRYYCYLAIAITPAAFYLVVINWLGMKYFRHN